MDKIDRFCYTHPNFGIPRLMLYIVIGCGIVSAMTLLGYTGLYSFLSFKYFNKTIFIRNEASLVDNDGIDVWQVLYNHVGASVQDLHTVEPSDVSQMVLQSPVVVPEGMAGAAEALLLIDVVQPGLGTDPVVREFRHAPGGGKIPGRAPVPSGYAGQKASSGCGERAGLHSRCR